MPNVCANAAVIQGSRRSPAWLALSLVAALALSACGSVPATVPPSAEPPIMAAPSATAETASTLGDALRGAIDIDDIVADLGRLQAIADSNAGTRAVGTSGYEASVTFVADELRRVGFDVELQPVSIPAFVQVAPSTLTISGAAGPPLEDIRDFKAMIYSGSGDVTAKVFALGFDPAARPGDRAGLGCEAGDWSLVPAGVIVLVQPGPCRRHDVVVLAQAAAVVGMVTSYADWRRDTVLRPTLIEPDDIRIPVVGATHAVGLALARAAVDGSEVHLVTVTKVERVEAMNVIGESPGGDPARVLMLGAHLDSVIDGPGINDNGSGTATILEIVRELAALEAATPGRAAWKVRVGFWTGEELGLFGSGAYTGALGSARDGPIRAYLNFDMLGSPNGIRVVYDGTGTSRPTEGARITGLFTTALDAAGLTWELQTVGAQSDQWGFEQAGIPIGGLFSGANELKTAEQASRFGGTADAPDDACYHLACDTDANIDPMLLEGLARAAAWVVGRLASGEVALE